MKLTCAKLVYQTAKRLARIDRYNAKHAPAARPAFLSCVVATCFLVGSCPAQQSDDHAAPVRRCHRLQRSLNRKSLRPSRFRRPMPSGTAPIFSCSPASASSAASTMPPPATSRLAAREEVLIPDDVVNNSAGFASLEAAGTVASVGLSYWMHRAGHHKLERWISIVHIGVTGFGVVRNYSLKSKHPAPVSGDHRASLTNCRADRLILSAALSLSRRPSMSRFFSLRALLSAADFSGTVRHAGRRGQRRSLPDQP